MFLLSFLIHVGVFSLVFFVPEPAPTRSLRGIIYEVNLVELPKSRLTGSRPGSGKSSKSKRATVSYGKRSRVRRIGKTKTKAKPLVIAKKVIKRKRKRIKKHNVSPDKALEETLARLEKKVEQESKTKEESAQAEQAISKIKERVEKEQVGATKPGPLGGGATTGLRIQIYKTEVENRIKSNWAYPIGIANENKRKGLEAVVVLTVSNDGTISQYRFKKRSGDPFFDESVAKAIERSNPLPPFPEGFLKNSEEIEINFNLSEFDSA